MKVLHVLNDIKHSGAELMLYSSYPMFKDNGYEFTALATGRNRGSFAGRFEEIGIRIEERPLVKSVKLPLKFFPYFIGFYKFLKKERFDVVHIHRMYLYFLQVI